MVPYRFRLIGLLAVLLAAAIQLAPPPAVAQTISPEQELADKYAPIAALRSQEKACDRSGEGYFPAPVDLILGNPGVTLKRHDADSSTNVVVKEAPVAQDLANLDDTYFLDLPGNPNAPGCTYETDFKRLVAESGAQPTTYAHIVVDHLRARLVVQYWFWYYFNDWNNTHESDWEMVQIVFDATTAEEALQQEPTQIGYAQHGGGELADWSDDKLERDGERLIVHPGAGSHATYYNSELYLGWGENGTGFGCDNTTAPSHQVPLNVVLIPDDPDPDGEFAWALFGGRWGELKSWEYSGPYGPNTGSKWLTPIGSMSNWRDTSLSVPASETLGPNATGLFCSLSKFGSRVLTRLWNNPPALVATTLGVIVAIGGLFFVKRQELGESLGLYRRSFKTFLIIGAATIPIGILFNGFAVLIRDVPPMDWIIKWMNDTAGARLTAAAAMGGIQQLAMILLVAPPIIVAVQEILGGRQPSALECFQSSYRRLPILLIALAIVSVALSLLVVLVIGIPVAIWLSVRWQFFGQATLLDHVGSGPAAVRRSGRVTSGRWWHAFGDSLLFQLFSLIPGPLVGLVLLLIGGVSVNFANAFSSIVFAITVPISVIGLTLAYRRYRDRQFGPGEHDVAVNDGPPATQPV